MPSRHGGPQDARVIWGGRTGPRWPELRFALPWAFQRFRPGRGRLHPFPAGVARGAERHPPGESLRWNSGPSLPVRSRSLTLIVLMTMQARASLKLAQRLSLLFDLTVRDYLAVYI